jgi:hypothetical protein
VLISGLSSARSPKVTDPKAEGFELEPKVEFSASSKHMFNQDQMCTDGRALADALC